MMDPKANLERQRELAAAIPRSIDLGAAGFDVDFEHVAELGLELAELVQALDEWRSKGGFDSQPVILTIRHPDYDNDYTVVGDVRIIDIDLGRGFDGGKGFRALDPEEQESYVENWRAEVADLPEDHLARQQVESLIHELQDGDY